jgi:hypothetical protein
MNHRAAGARYQCNAAGFDNGLGYFNSSALDAAGYERGQHLQHDWTSHRLGRGVHVHSIRLPWLIQFAEPISRELAVRDGGIDIFTLAQ